MMVRSLIRSVGDDPDRPGVTDTPSRFIRAFTEIAGGGARDPADELTTMFDETCDEMIVVRDIAFTSLCEHHLLPFTGSASVGYLPKDGLVVGLSKLARLVVAAARRLQVQERMTRQITSAIMRKLEPAGAGCIVRAHHSCMGCRGVKQPGAEMVTSSMVGCFREDAAVRREFFGLVT
jgi:GTP cyclohydrolase I